MHGWFDSGVQILIAAVAAFALVVSVVALIPAFIGLDRARKANDLANDANTVAAQANNLSAVANGIALVSQQRDHESHDVSWTLGYLGESAYLLFNEGLDPAYRVRAYVRSSGGGRGILRTETTAPSGGEPILVPAVPDSVLVRHQIEGYEVFARIHWFSERGASHSVSLTVDGELVVRRGMPKG